jgi:hypothetical protein
VISGPFIVSLLPPFHSAPSISTAKVSSHQSPALYVHSVSSLALVQIIPLPPRETDMVPPVGVGSVTARFLTAPSRPDGPVMVFTAPSAADAEGAPEPTVWQLNMKDWDSQFDEMIANGDYDEALNLLEASSGGAVVNEKVNSYFPLPFPLKSRALTLTGACQSKRRQTVLTLHAVSLFKRKAYDKAIDSFIDLDSNPAKVASLYPPRISGRLFHHPDAREELFGGRSESAVRAERELNEQKAELEARREEERAKDAQPSSGSPMKSSVRKARKDEERDDDVSSVRSGKGRPVEQGRGPNEAVDGTCIR